MKGVLDLSVEVPACDCLATYKEPKPGEPVHLHRPDCPRMKAIRRKWGVE